MKTSATKPNLEAWTVRPFGMDCLGNITGYRVARGHGLGIEVAQQFVGNIYEAGSFDRARAGAEAMCALLNADPNMEG